MPERPKINQSMTEQNEFLLGNNVKICSQLKVLFFIRPLGIFEKEIV